jgi:AbrB family looped-hinge helix DNA binding protein
MAVATLTSKGQTTIPSEVRSYLGLHTGDKLEFIIEEDGRVILEALTSDVRELKGILSKPKKAVTVEQMNKAIAKRGGSL